jgi:hypothetical protein
MFDMFRGSSSKWLSSVFAGQKGISRQEANACGAVVEFPVGVFRVQLTETDFTGAMARYAVLVQSANSDRAGSIRALYERPEIAGQC